MLHLVFLTLGLIVASSLLLAILHRGFVRGITWFDDRNEARERAEAAARARYERERREAAQAKNAAKEDEWAEIIDV